METSFPNNKRPFDHTTSGVDQPHHPPTPITTTKRRHLHHHPTPPTPPTTNPFRPPIKLSTGETLFRILCPSSKTGGLIGKGGSVIRQVREETGAKIRIDESIPGSDERVIYIVSDSNPNPSNSNSNSNSNNEDNDIEKDDCEESLAQKALIRVFERILKVDEERSKVVKEESENGEENVVAESGTVQGQVVCRLLCGGNQIGCVLGRGGKIIEKIRQESGAVVRVLPKDQLPECASPGDELIQMAGRYPAVRKAISYVSGCLQEAGNSSNNRPMGMVPHGYGNDHHQRMGMDEEVVFRLLCHGDKVGSLIGKGGSIRRTLQTETGACIKIADSTPDSDDRVVVISARESLEQRHSPAQDAVMRVLGRIADGGFEPGAAVVARLLVHSRQIGCLWGKGGMIIAELRRVSGASIHIFPREQFAKYGMPSDEVVQVIGSLPCVQDALFQITGRLRETFYPVKPYHSNAMGPPHMEMPPPSFRPRHDPASPVGPFEHPPHFMHGVDHHHHHHHHPRPNYSYSYGNEHQGYGGRWNSESGGNRYQGEYAEFDGGVAKVNDTTGRNEMSSAGNTTFEIVVPQYLVGCLYGEDNNNMSHIEPMSGAKVTTNPVREGVQVLLSGTPDQVETAKCLVHAFIMCDKVRLGL